MAPPSALVLPKAQVSFSVASSANADGSVDVDVKAEGGVALFATLTTLANGRFSDNAFALTGSATLQFIPFGELDLPKLTKSLRIEHLQQNL
eukprot:5772545-Prymnesium_polylepis.2